MPAASRQPTQSAIIIHRMDRSRCLVADGAAWSDGMRRGPKDATAARGARRVRRPGDIGRDEAVARPIRADPFSGGATLTIDTVESPAVRDALLG